MLEDSACVTAWLKALASVCAIVGFSVPPFKAAPSNVLILKPGLPLGSPLALVDGKPFAPGVLIWEAAEPIKF